MKYLLYSIAFCCSVVLAHAQVIQGTVCDSKTREALVGVVVYLDGTSVVTTSDNNGKFWLAVQNKMNANLIFSHLSYESLVIEKPFEHQGAYFFLNERANLLNAAVVVADYDPFRAERMRIFKKFFLGESAAAKSCIILNEDDVILRYDNNTDILYASAHNPLMVENRHLGYRITIDIQYFQVKYTYAAVAPSNRSAVRIPSSVKSPDFDLIPSSFLYKINYFFEDQNPHDILLTRRRNEIYERSRQYFWSSLITNFALKESGFKVYNKYKEVNAEDYFSVLTDPIDQTKVVLINPDTDINRKHNEVLEGTIYGVLGVRAYKNIDSQLIFLTDRFYVDLFGNIAESGLIYKGDMALQRVGDMLPRDFIYRPSKVSAR